MLFNVAIFLFFNLAAEITRPKGKIYFFTSTFETNGKTKHEKSKCCKID